VIDVLRFFAIDHVLVSFVTIATTGAIFSLQFTKNRLAAGLRWRRLSAPPDPLAAKQGPTSEGREREGVRMGGEGRGWEGKGKEETGKDGRGGKGREGEKREGRGGERREGRRRRGRAPNANSWIRPWTDRHRMTA